MKQMNTFLTDMIDIQPGDTSRTLYRALPPTAAQQSGADVVMTIPFVAVNNPATGHAHSAGAANECKHSVRIRAYGNNIVRVSMIHGTEIPDEKNPMYQPSADPESFGKTESKNLSANKSFGRSYAVAQQPAYSYAAAA